MPEPLHEYLITFELSAPLDQYRYLSIQLAALHAQQVEHNAWRVSVDEDTAADLTADLTRFLHNNDRLEIVRVDSGEPGSFNPKKPF